MLGFAIVDRQPHAEHTAVWTTSCSAEHIVRHTNAVVLRHDDPGYVEKMRSLTADRSVVLTDGSEPPVSFAHAVRIEVFDDLVDATTRLQESIAQAVAEYSRRKKTTLVVPTYLPVPEHSAPEHDEARFRALAVADHIGRVWTAWLFTEEHRQRRTVAPRTQETPWIMPIELNSPTIATLPAEFVDRVKPEPLS
ncbi:hypothetical protein ACFC06_26710 [Nocardia sp. NPDC056064]|uniref:hypothetical protein n=1 Tax=Nocardia sp. NPDC056064 TaxID=3345701 RepID=UPI0035DED028